MSDNMNVTKTDQASNTTQTGQTQNTPRQALAPAVDIADIEADLDMGEAVDPAAQPLKQGLDLGPGGGTLRKRLPAQPPHHDVPDRARHFPVSSPAILLVFGLS